MDKNPILHLRGPCIDSSVVDTKYVFLPEVKNDYIFQGFSGLSAVIGNLSKNSWDFVSFSGPSESIITTTDNLMDFPFGRQKWIAKTPCGKNKTEHTFLKFSKVIKNCCLNSLLKQISIDVIDIDWEF